MNGLPWSIVNIDPVERYLADSYGFEVSMMCKENLDFIIKAVNNHYALVEIAEAYVETIEGSDIPPVQARTFLKPITDLLNKLK